MMFKGFPPIFVVLRLSHRKTWLSEQLSQSRVVLRTAVHRAEMRIQAYTGSSMGVFSKTDLEMRRRSSMNLGHY